ncbi:MAG: hypothetical protein HOB79_06300 [Rhodospirillaceae bacterium]|jgi:hypothetical protein|nr:hypothetical protein [Rhodospirillales bacterium]MBT4700671.1 hypothetical protein [Rhodospirillaceae bacterium]MBT5032877.1 hypothetical protein [Rhodospirillaceae bacterium]
MRILTTIVLFSSFLIIPHAASALTLGQSEALSWFEKKLLPVKVSCVRIIKKSGREQLVNRCRSCLVVQIKRTRPGRPEGALRDITIGANQSTTLSFRGPGVTRISSELTCAAAQSLETPKEENKVEPQQCLRLIKHDKIGMVMVNTCATCRKAVIERRFDKGGRKLANISVGANTYAPVLPLGANFAKIVNEKSCR